jgi:hypothetical protein
LFSFPAGHIKTNKALKLGVSYELNVGEDEVELVEVRPLVSADVINTRIISLPPENAGARSFSIIHLQLFINTHFKCIIVEWRLFLLI